MRVLAETRKSARAALLAALCVFCVSCKAAPKTTAELFAFDTCGGCNIQNPCKPCTVFNGLVNEYTRVLKEAGLSEKTDLVPYNIYFDAQREVFREKMTEAGFDVEAVTAELPAVLLDGKKLVTGKDAIAAALARGRAVTAGAPPSPSGMAENTAVYFYITGCASCAKAEKILETLHNTTIEKHNVINPGAAALFTAYCDYYRVPEAERLTPLLFAGGRWFMGDAINGETKTFVESAPPATPVFTAGETPENLETTFEGFTFAGALVTGIINGINPCSLSILIMLVSLIASRGLKILTLGSAYCAGKFLAYFAIGLLFYTALADIEIARYLFAYRVAMTVLCLFFIGGNLLDMAAALREDYGRIRLQLPGKLKGMNFSLVKKWAKTENLTMLVLLCFAAGAVTSAGEFFCTGQIYLSTILYMIHNRTASGGRAIMFFFIYSLGFVLPFFTVTALLHKGAAFFDISDFIRSRLPVIKGVNAALFAVILLLVWAL